LWKLFDNSVFSGQKDLFCIFIMRFTGVFTITNLHHLPTNLQRNAYRRKWWINFCFASQEPRSSNPWKFKRSMKYFSRTFHRKVAVLFFLHGIIYGSLHIYKRSPISKMVL
jgi:hypothetical protein